MCRFCSTPQAYKEGLCAPCYLNTHSHSVIGGVSDAERHYEDSLIPMQRIDQRQIVNS